MKLRSLSLLAVVGLCLLPGHDLQTSRDVAGTPFSSPGRSPSGSSQSSSASRHASVTQAKQEGDMNIVIKVPERLKPIISNLANQFLGGIKPTAVHGGSGSPSSGSDSSSSEGISSSLLPSSLGSGMGPSSGYMPSGSGYGRPQGPGSGYGRPSSGSGFDRPFGPGSGRPHGSGYGRPGSSSNRPYVPEGGSGYGPGYGSSGSSGSDSNQASWTDIFPDVCGVETSTKIIGGVDADPKKWKWMAGLIKGRGGQRSFCGGALITDRHVLTAAHCLTKVTPNDIMIRIGEYDFSDSVEDGEDFAITNFKIHPRYNTNNQENDIAIITLRQRVPFDGLIKPVCLPQRNRDYAGQIATVVGWGATAYTGSGSSRLKQVSLPVWPKADCAGVFHNKVEGKSMICAGLKEGGRDSCQGDSGGPLMVMGPQNRWMIAGIVSWGIKCGTPGFPGVYTKVSDYIDWIHENIEN